jgi:hypothetical protein
MGFWLRTSYLSFARIVDGTKKTLFREITSIGASAVRGHIDSVEIMKEHGWSEFKPIVYRVVFSELCGIESDDGDPFQIMMLACKEEEDDHDEARQVHGPRYNRGIHLGRRTVVR